ncbi:MAG: hypothetical protein A2167_02755 [Planctomycetes bacterium RBG_13_46_10]|nr:MAG: hypothetical protein A2167_02755 [Planctomycetes bacterium RBG_13_46_10]
MGSFSNHWENKILNYIFGKDSYSPPTIYVGLSTADPLDDASGLAEPIGNGYARTVTSTSDWNTASEGMINNLNELIFSEATGSWGTITHFALFDAATGGNMLCHGSLNQSRAIVSSDRARFTAGDLSASLD